MKKKRLILTSSILTMILLFSACGNKGSVDESSIKSEEVTVASSETMAEESTSMAEETTTMDEMSDVIEPYAKNIFYSNLVDEESRRLLTTAFYDGGLGTEDVEYDPVSEFFDAVKDYNKSVGNIDMVDSGFEIAPTIDDMKFYDIETIIENWDKAHPNFIGYNCRMTTFLLAETMIDFGQDVSYVEDEGNFLFQDYEAIENEPREQFDEENIAKFSTFYTPIPAQMTKDIDVHVKEVLDYWASKGISFVEDGAKVVTVWFHNDLDNIIFVGHTGIMMPNPEGNSILFVEKISFEDPYQMLKFKDEQALSDYLMAKYDVSYGQPTAKPFVMVNDKLIEGYRANPQNVE